MPSRSTRAHVTVVVVIAAIAAGSRNALLSSTSVALSAAGREAAVFGSTAALLAMFFMGTLLAQWFGELVRRAEGRVREAPRPGYGIFHGVARSTGTDASLPLVLRTRIEIQKRSSSDDWQLVHQTIAAHPFRLVLESGHELEVSPGEPVVEGFAASRTAPGRAPQSGSSRSSTTSVADGDRVWITGWLERPKARGAGAYRTISANDRLVAHGREPMVISKDLPAERWRDRAKAHRVSAFVAMGILVVLHATLFQSFDWRFVSFPRENKTFALFAISTQAMLLAPIAVLAAALVWRELVSRCKRKWA